MSLWRTKSTIASWDGSNYPQIPTLSVSMTRIVKMRCLMTKPTKWYVRPAKTDQPGHPPSLIRVFAVRMKKHWVLSYPFSALRRLWSDWADAQADLSLRWAHMPRHWFCHEAAQITWWLQTVKYFSDPTSQTTGLVSSTPCLSDQLLNNFWSLICKERNTP